MARIRTIKPEFWTDEKLAPLRPVDRLVFIGLISQADDAGRLVDNVKLIDGLLFPDTDDSSLESIEILARLSRVCRYRGPSGQRLLQVVKWSDHQRVVNPSKYVLPGPSPEALAALSVTPPYLESSESLNRSSLDPKSPTYDPRPTSKDLGTGINDPRPPPPTPSAAPNARPDPEPPIPDEVVAVVLLFEQKGKRQVRPGERTELIAMCSSYGDDRVTTAIGIAAKNEKVNVPYIDGILRNGGDRKPATAPTGGRECGCGAALGPRDHDLCWKCQEVTA